MRAVERNEILDYVTYGEERSTILEDVLEQKKPRRIHVGDYLTFLFENHDTVRFQIQEMIRVELIVKESDIQHEVDTYNELLGGDATANNLEHLFGTNKRFVALVSIAGQQNSDGVRGALLGFFECIESAHSR